MIVLGGAWQSGGLPLSLAAIEGAIALNGAAVAANARAFAIGRWAVVDPAAAMDAAGLGRTPGALPPDPPALADLVARRADHLTAYKNASVAVRYRAFVARCVDPTLARAVALVYHKVLAYKDEYEVARLHLASRKAAEAAFDGDLRLTFHLAPPILSRRDAAGRPRKRAFGGWIERLFPLLAGMKRLRGTVVDPFGFSAERRAELAAIAADEADLAPWLAETRPERLDKVIAIAELPLQVRGFGPVKARAAATAELRRAELVASLLAPPQAQAAE